MSSFYDLCKRSVKKALAEFELGVTYYMMSRKAVQKAQHWI